MTAPRSRKTGETWGTLLMGPIHPTHDRYIQVNEPFPCIRDRDSLISAATSGAGPAVTESVWVKRIDGPRTQTRQSTRTA